MSKKSKEVTVPVPAQAEICESCQWWHAPLCGVAHDDGSDLDEFMRVFEALGNQEPPCRLVEEPDVE